VYLFNFVFHSDFPLDIISTRLVNGVGLADGRVEILVNDTWGTLCGKNIHKEAADVICRMQGFRYVCQ
jgi:hypothetical protein